MAEETIEEKRLIEQEPEPEPEQVQVARTRAKTKPHPNRNQLTTHPYDEQQPEISEKKKERIVPFNVLMLKSDRAKLSTNQPVQNTKEPEVTKQIVVEKESTSHPENRIEEYIMCFHHRNY